MRARFAEPDYQLMWPRSLFVAEAAKLLNHRDVRDWDERCALLLEHAFIGGYAGGPLSEFREVSEDGFGAVSDNPWGKPAKGSTFTRTQQFLRDLMGKADQLAEDGSHRRPYWRERKAGQRTVVVLDNAAVIREFISLVNEFDHGGYFEKRFGKDCVDDPRDDAAELLFRHELGVEGIWPLNQDRLKDDIDLFLDVIELLHDHVARSITRYFHDYSGCGWHHTIFEIEPGRVAYRWRVNKMLERSNFGLRLADEGDDVGRLVTVHRRRPCPTCSRCGSREDGEPADQVRHALALFRERGADRN